MKGTRIADAVCTISRFKEQSHGYYGNRVYGNPYSYYGNGYYAPSRGGAIGGVIGNAVGGRRATNLGYIIGDAVRN